MLMLPPARCLKCDGTSNLTIHHSPSRGVIKAYAPFLTKKFKEQFNDRPEIGLFVLCKTCHKEFTKIENEIRKNLLNTVIDTFTSAFSTFVGFEVVPAWSISSYKCVNKAKKLNSDSRRYAAL